MALKLKGRESKLTYRRRLIIIATGSIIAASSLLFTSDMVRRLREKEKNEVASWAFQLEKSWHFNPYDPLFERMSRGDIPFMILDQNFNVVLSNLIPEKTLAHPDLLLKEIDRLSRANKHIFMRAVDGSDYFVFYGESVLLKMLRYFPFVQISVIIIFFAFAYITFFSAKHDEQNRVWIGLAKETAHQLGTPTSSLLGWIEYLRTQPVDQSAVEEMNKDLNRLMKVTERFSKIGSETLLEPANLNEVVGNSVLYFKNRIPKNVQLTYNGLAIAPVQAMINPALFEWVIENLLKNSLDALQGTGLIDVKISSDEDHVYINVTDTGKGIPKSNFKRIFEPGYSTKTRGWGLGLSLSKRIIDTYHKGRIFVADSEPGKGSTFSVILKRTYL